MTKQERIKFNAITYGSLTLGSFGFALIIPFVWPAFFGAGLVFALMCAYEIRAYNLNAPLVKLVEETVALTIALQEQHKYQAEQLITQAEERMKNGADMLTSMGRLKRELEVLVSEET